MESDKKKLQKKGVRACFCSCFWCVVCRFLFFRSFHVFKVNWKKNYYFYCLVYLHSIRNFEIGMLCMLARPFYYINTVKQHQQEQPQLILKHVKNFNIFIIKNENGITKPIPFKWRSEFHFVVCMCICICMILRSFRCLPSSLYCNLCKSFLYIFFEKYSFAFSPPSVRAGTVSLYFLQFFFFWFFLNMRN